MQTMKSQTYVLYLHTNIQTHIRMYSGTMDLTNSIRIPDYRNYYSIRVVTVLLEYILLSIFQTYGSTVQTHSQTFQKTISVNPAHIYLAILSHVTCII